MLKLFWCIVFRKNLNIDVFEQIRELQENPSPNWVERMILEAVNMFESSGSYSDLEVRQLRTIFSQYEVVKLTQSRELEEILVQYLTTLWIENLRGELPSLDVWDLTENTIPSPLTPQEVLAWFQGLEELPKFSSFQDFKNSDFFLRNYNLGEETLFFDYESWNQQRLNLVFDTNIQKLQVMLIFLWYMTEEELYWDYWIDESGKHTISYFWLGWPVTFSHVEEFQIDEDIEVDGVVWEETRERLYRKIYEVFHML